MRKWDDDGQPDEAACALGEFIYKARGLGPLGWFSLLFGVDVKCVVSGIQLTQCPHPLAPTFGPNNPVRPGPVPQRPHPHGDAGELSHRGAWAAAHGAHTGTRTHACMLTSRTHRTHFHPPTDTALPFSRPARTARPRAPSSSWRSRPPPPSSSASSYTWCVGGGGCLIGRDAACSVARRRMISCTVSTAFGTVNIPLPARACPWKHPNRNRNSIEMCSNAPPPVYPARPKTWPRSSRRAGGWT
jgi:hypothetical protein